MPLQVLQRPFWTGTPRETSELFMLHKNRPEAKAVSLTHHLAWEVRLLFLPPFKATRTRVCKTHKEVFDRGEWCRAAMIKMRDEAPPFDEAPVPTLTTSEETEAGGYQAREQMESAKLLRTTILFLCIPVLTAQNKPSFSGTWAPVEGVNPRTELTIMHDADRLVGRAGDDPSHRFEYRLDGSEVKQAVGSVTSKAQWDDDRIVVTNTFRSNDALLSVQRQVWAITTEGLLVIETTREREGQPAQTSKSTYKRLAK